MLRLAIAMIIAASACSVGGGIRAAKPVAAAHDVGMTRRDFIPPEPYDWRGDPKHRLRTLVWYPADRGAPQKPLLVGPPDRPLFDGGRAAVGAPLASVDGKFPLVVLSHGFGATGGNLAWLGEALAAHGYIAAAVDHPGNNALDGITVPGMTLWWLRVRDLSAVIDAMLADAAFGPRIDTQRIGAAGHSLGGYAVISLAGGITSRAHFLEVCAVPGAEIQCRPPRGFADLGGRVQALIDSDPVYRAATTDVGSYRDPRVHAAFAMAPGLATAFLPDSLQHIDIPVAIVAGAADEDVPIKSNAEYFATKIPRTELTILPAPVGHNVFAGICLDGGRMALPAVCNDPPGVDRAAIETQTADLALAFFARQLR